jgi:hypothetical protein
MRYSLGRQLTLTLTLTVVAAASVLAQATTQVSTATSAAKAEPGRGDPKKILNVGDYGRWNRITQTAISADGNWMTYAYQPYDGDATLFVKELEGYKLYTIAIG